MALQSNADLASLVGLLPVSSVSWPLFPVFNFTFINICLCIVPPSVFGHILGFLTISFCYGHSSSACRPTPNLEGQSTVFIIPRAGWLTYTTRHQVPILAALYDLPGLQWHCCFPRYPQWIEGFLLSSFVLRAASSCAHCTRLGNQLPRVRLEKRIFVQQVMNSWFFVNWQYIIVFTRAC